MEPQFTDEIWFDNIPTGMYVTGKTYIKGIKMGEKKEMLSAGKIATKLGVTPAQIKKAIQSAGIEPTSVKNGCSYYDEACVKKIQKAMQ